MRSVNADSAASPDGRNWDQIDWPTVHRRVRRLQTRIAKATRDQNWRRVSRWRKHKPILTRMDFVEVEVRRTLSRACLLYWLREPLRHGSWKAIF